MKTKVKHGMSRTHFYKRWHTILNRCENKKASNYKFYGGKGIKIEWKNFEEFKKDMYESYLEHVKKYGEKDTTLDRLNNNKNYCKENCQWATWDKQHKNTSKIINITHNGETLDIADWARKLKLHPQTLYSRLDKLKMPIELALTSKKFSPGKNWQKQL
jgi:hypothetical protein